MEGHYIVPCQQPKLLIANKLGVLIRNYPHTICRTNHMLRNLTLRALCSLGLLRSVILHVEFEQEEDGRWIAEIVELPGVMVYGQSQKDAFERLQPLAYRVIADRLEHGEWPASIPQPREPLTAGIRLVPAHA